MSDWAQQERRVLAGSLRDLGPDASTACDGSRTREMAAHLYIRERRVDAAPGVVLPGPFASYTDRVMGSVLRVHPYDELVGTVAAGPPLPLRPLDELINVFEFFVHSEDVRRVNGGTARNLPVEQERLMWRRLRPTLRAMFRRANGIRVEIETPSGQQATVGSGGPTARLRAPVGEVVLYAYNRKGIADVAVTGDAEAVSRLADAQLGP